MGEHYEQTYGNINFNFYVKSLRCLQINKDIEKFTFNTTVEHQRDFTCPEVFESEEFFFTIEVDAGDKKGDLGEVTKFGNKTFVIARLPSIDHVRILSSYREDNQIYVRVRYSDLNLKDKRAKVDHIELNFQPFKEASNPGTQPLKSGGWLGLMLSGFGYEKVR